MCSIVPIAGHPVFDNTTEKVKPVLPVKKAVDFDGTLAEYFGWDDPRNGKPIWPMVNRVKQWLDEGVVVVIFTARVSSQHSPEQLRRQRNIINSWCLNVFGRVFEVTAEKTYDIEEYWDDRAIGVQFNKGIPVVPQCLLN
jgi:hypothetical protein